MSVVYGDAARETERIRLTMTEDVSVFDSLSAMVTYLDEHSDEDMVVVGPDAPMSVATEIAEKYRLDRPTLGVILLRRRVEMQTMAEALRSGIREVVRADDAEALLEACKRSATVSRQLRHAERRMGDGGNGRVILVFSAKGGCGKTTLATNLAEAWPRWTSGKVCLVDFNLTFGDVAIALQVDPTKTISDALGMQGGLDRQGVESMVIPYKERFDVLLAPTQPADAEFISAALAAEILGILTEMYQYVVIDSPPMFSDVVLKCFDIADSYVLPQHARHALPEELQGDDRHPRRPWVPAHTLERRTQPLRLPRRAQRRRGRAGHRHDDRHQAAVLEGRAGVAECRRHPREPEPPPPLQQGRARAGRTAGGGLGRRAG